MDIGDKVKKADVLANLFAPELVEDLETKKATVVLDRERIALAKEVVEVAKADVTAAVERFTEAEAILDKFESEVDRWETEVKRLDSPGRAGCGRCPGPVRVDQSAQVEHCGGDKARRPSSGRRRSCSPQARLAKAEVDVRVAQADPQRGRERRAMGEGLGRLPDADRPLRRRDLRAQRQHVRFRPADDGRSDGVLSLAGLSPSGAAAPIYVVDRLDMVARLPSTFRSETPTLSTIGTKASVLARAFRDTELPATVTRTLVGAHMKSRTLRAEIDLPNPESRLFLACTRM